MKVPGSDDGIEGRWHSLLDRLEQGGRLESPRIRAALEALPRWRFIGPDPSRDKIEGSLRDAPLPIGQDQTISAPHMVAILLEQARPSPGDRCLEIGAGSGWLASLLAHVVGPDGHVIAMEVREELAEMGRRNLVGSPVEDRVEIIVGDGSTGYPPGGPYDVIIVSAAAPSVPDPLVEQLGLGGRLVIPVGERGHQQLYLITKTPDGIERSAKGGCAFVPLIGEHGF